MIAKKMDIGLHVDANEQMKSYCLMSIIMTKFIYILIPACPDAFAWCSKTLHLFRALKVYHSPGKE